MRTNALNLVRLGLALLVLVAHGYYLSGAGTGPSWRGENLGGWAVFSFFTLSGYLITASRFANPLPRFLALRVARIYPAFLVCLLLTVVVFAPLAWWAEGRPWAAYLSTPTTPLAYVAQNLGLHIGVYDVGGTPAAVPYPGAWNGSLWTLFFEFCCYLAVGLLVCLPVVRRRRGLLGVAFALSVLAWATAPAWSAALPSDLALLARLLPPFLGGALVQVLVGRRGFRMPLAVAAAALSALLVAHVDLWGAQLAAPLIAYALLWLGTVLPSPGLVQRHDISYGVYIYAFPVQQLLVYAGATRLGLAGYDVVAALATAALATLSWRLVERPVLRAARRRVSRPGSGPRGDVAPQHPQGVPALVAHDPRDEGQPVRP